MDDIYLDNFKRREEVSSFVLDKVHPFWLVEIGILVNMCVLKLIWLLFRLLLELLESRPLWLEICEVRRERLCRFRRELLVYVAKRPLVFFEAASRTIGGELLNCDLQSDACKLLSIRMPGEMRLDVFNAKLAECRVQALLFKLPEHVSLLKPLEEFLQQIIRLSCVRFDRRCID